MQAYQFTAKVTSDGKLPIPTMYTKSLSAGHIVQVLVLVPETHISHKSQKDEGLSLEEIVAQIQQLPADPANIEPATGSLAEYLANTPNDRDPDFDVSAWNKEWDSLEAEMKASSLAHEEAEKNL
jgi:hypothetical protein